MESMQLPTCERGHSKAIRIQKETPAWGSVDTRYLAKWRIQMKLGTKDEIKGNIHEIKGAVKEAAGRITKNSKLEAKGKAEQSLGKVEKKVGQFERVLGK